MRFAAFDVETTGQLASWESGAVVSPDRRVWTADRREWLEAMREEARAGSVLVAHHAEYDVTHGLWAAGEDVTCHYFNGSFTLGFWRWKRSGPAARIWDSYGLSAQRPLHLVGQELGLPKLERPQLLTAAYQARRDAWTAQEGAAGQGGDWSHPDRFRWFCERHRVGECLECYNLRDCDIVLGYVQQLVAELEGYGIRPSSTLAGNAAKLWTVLDPGRQQRLRSDQVRRLARAAYHGGRTEAFRYGTYRPVFTHDVRNQYLAIMRDRQFPDCSALFYSSRAGSSIDLDQVEGVVECEVTTPDLHVPVLPVVHGDQVFYPVGRFRGVWTIAELRAAIERGYQVTDWGAAAWSRRTVQPFQTYAGVVLERRRHLAQQQDPRELAWKTIGNALSGRLGTSSGGEKQVYRRRVAGLQAKDRAGSELNFAGLTAFLSWRHRVPTEPQGANVLWAAHVTGYGRLQLQEHLEAAGDELLYCDTDSVFATRPLVTVEDEPGRLRDTGVYQEGVFLGPKLYRLTTREGVTVVRAKGVPQRVAEEYFAAGKVVYETATGVIEAIARGIEPGRWEPVERTRRSAPARRQPTNPAALLDRDQTSETVPLAFAGEGELITLAIAEARAAR